MGVEVGGGGRNGPQTPSGVIHLGDGVSTRWVAGAGVGKGQWGEGGWGTARAVAREQRVKSIEVLKGVLVIGGDISADQGNARLGEGRGGGGTRCGGVGAVREGTPNSDPV